MNYVAISVMLGLMSVAIADLFWLADRKFAAIVWTLTALCWIASGITAAISKRQKSRRRR